MVLARLNGDTVLTTFAEMNGGRGMPKRKMMKKVRSMFANGPAANMASCAFAGFFGICCSSGSTNAAGTMGRRTPRMAMPLLCTLMLWQRAMSPCANSWSAAMTKMLMIQ